MSAETQTLRIEQNVKAPPTQVYLAFTNATALREWMCDMATALPKPGGRLYLAWNAGFYMAGEFTTLEPDHVVGFTWFGRGEPAPSQVKVTLSPQGDGTMLRLEHSGFGSSEEWARVIPVFESEWKSGLENLVSVLETGKDLRFVRRPMLGIGIGDFTPKTAKELGVPVSEGIRLDNVIVGMGARAAGLQKDDIIVGIAGRAVTDWASLTSALEAQHAGDKVEVVIYRGPEKKTVTMELSRRPLPEIPANPKSLAEAVRNRYAEQHAALAQLFEGVSEAEASFQPAEGEWNAKEVLAHLIEGERFVSFLVGEMVGHQERWTDDFGGNVQATIEGTLSAYPSIAELLEEFKRNGIETVATLAALPAEFVAYKGSYWRLAYNSLQPDIHFYEHLDQMRASIQSARSKASGS